MTLHYFLNGRLDPKQDLSTESVDGICQQTDSRNRFYLDVNTGPKYKATTWYLNGFPSLVVTLGQQCDVGEKPTAILYTYINHHAQPPIIPQHNHSNT